MNFFKRLTWQLAMSATYQGTATEWNRTFVTKINQAIVELRYVSRSKGICEKFRIVIASDIEELTKTAMASNFNPSHETSVSEDTSREIKVIVGCGNENDQFIVIDVI